MNHDPIHELMLVYAAGGADADERARAEQLLASGDVVAQAAYAEAMAVVNAIPLALDPVSPPKQVRDALLLRIAADASNDPSNLRITPANAARPASRRMGWPTWAAGAIAACLALALTLTLAQNRRMQSQLAVRVQQDATMRTVASSPWVQFAKLTYDNQPDGLGKPGGRILYCPVSKQYQVMVYRLTPPPPGRVYELWLITPDKKLPAGTFTVDEAGNATFYARAPRDEQITVAAITDEPVGGSETPTGTTRLACHFQ